MFRSLSDHHQEDTIFVLTSVTKVIDVAPCLLQCVCWVLSCPVIITITGQDRTQHTHYNRHAATSITLVTEVKTNIVYP